VWEIYPTCSQLISTLSGDGQPGDKYGCSEDFRSN